MPRVFIAASAADVCKHRGELDVMCCDDNNDMVADPPSDPKKCKNPSTIVFTYTPVEDPAVYENIFRPVTTYLSQCLDKKVVFYQVQSNAAEIEATRSGRLHVAGFSTGPTAFGVNLAGAVPFAVKGTEKEFQGYNLIVIVKASSPCQKLSDLKGKKVAHTSPSSNSGHLAPMALFPDEGPTPDKDYKTIFSGKHDQSVMGVNSGDYGAAAVASDVFHRMAERGRVREADLRIIYRSQKFPTSSFAYAHDPRPAAGRQDARLLLRVPVPARNEKSVRRRRPFLPHQLQDDLGGRARLREGLRRGIRQGELRKRDGARGGRSCEEEVTPFRLLSPRRAWRSDGNDPYRIAGEASRAAARTAGRRAGCAQPAPFYAD
jgi:phosphonate transport system substrate-binding protein